jgi:formate-dependent nitrite reductase membrane component NrfD
VSDSYYGRPVIKAHPWHWYIDLYFWIGGMAGAAGVTCVVARNLGYDKLATVQKRAALAGVLVSPLLLIADLGMPERFINMLRVFKVTSPMSVGTWILSAFGGAIVASTAAEVVGWQRTSRGLEYVVAFIGPMLTVYTAVLIADTATPIWHEAYETLPFVFVASGVSAAGAVGAAFAPAAERRLARRMMTIGALALGVAGQVMERRLGTLLAEPYRQGRGGTLKRISGALGIVGAVVSLAGRNNATTTRIAAVCVALAGICERFAVMSAGKQSANDPKYVVAPQRARRDAREAASAP